MLEVEDHIMDRVDQVVLVDLKAVVMVDQVVPVTDKDLDKEAITL